MKLYPVQINFQVSAEDGAALDAVKHLFNGSRAEVIRACLPYLDRAVKARQPRPRRGTTAAVAKACQHDTVASAAGVRVCLDCGKQVPKAAKTVPARTGRLR